MDWLEEVAARQAILDPRTPGFEWIVPVTPQEVDRLVRIARGVRELAERWKDADADEYPLDVGVRRLLAELRKLEDV